MRPAWEWGRLAQSGRLSAACGGWRTVVTQVWAPSSQSRPPSGRDGTRAHPEQPAWPCQGPRDLRSCGSQQGVSCTLCLLAGSSGGEKRVDLVPHANSGPRVGKTRSAQVTARKTGQCDGKCVPGSFPLSFVVVWWRRQTEAMLVSFHLSPALNLC